MVSVHGSFVPGGSFEPRIGLMKLIVKIWQLGRDGTEREPLRLFPTPTGFERGPRTEDGGLIVPTKGNTGTHRTPLCGDTLDTYIV